MISLQNQFRRLYSSAARIRIKNLHEIPSKDNVNIRGWVKSIRKHKKVTFLDVKDGSSVQSLQVVLPAENPISEDLYYGSAVEINGILMHRPNKKPTVELQCTDIFLHRTCDTSSYPLQSDWDHPLKYTRQFPHLRPRQTDTAAILRVRNNVEMLIHEYFQERNFIHIHTPVITSNDCEGAGDLFSVTTDEKSNEHNTKFFDVPTFLTVSGQLHLEACALGVGDVYTLSPAFRAEQSRPKTHLSEFHMLEIEVAFTKSLEDLLVLIEESLKHVISKTLDKCSGELEMFHAKAEMTDYRSIVEKSVTAPFIRLEYDDAVRLLTNNSDKLQTGIKWGDDLNAEHEIFLTTCHGHQPVFVTNFPASLKPFYTLHNNDQKTCASFDLLFPHCGEMAGGTLREHRFHVLRKRLEQSGLEKEYEWYTDLRRFGGVSHGGYGLGFDRLIRFLLGVNNIRDVVPFPRASHLCLL